MNNLNSYLIQIISKYLNSIEDYKNITKTCKEYQYVIDNFKYNPISIHDYNKFIKSDKKKYW